MKIKNQTNCPIAIVGMSALFPGSENTTGFWQNLLCGEDQLKEVPKSHWLINDYYDVNPKARDKTYGKRGGFLPDVVFDPLAFGLLPNALEATDSGQLLALLVAKQVLEDAYQGQFNHADKRKISVILGTAGSTELVLEMAGRMERPKWVKALREEGLDEDRVQSVCDRIAAQYVEWQESSFPGLLPNVVAGRIAHRLDLGGTNFITDAACASSLAALGIGLNELYLGRSDLVITGGVDALNTISMYVCFSKTPALSATEDCRPFADNADGTMLSEGVGMIAIKRLADAQRDGDQIYAVIKALGASSDGKGKSVYAPSPKGQARCLQQAYALAGYDPSTVELLEAHGTATKAGDTAEVEGLSEVFKSNAKHKNWCALGSVKSNIGHTKAAAGIAGLMKAVLALNHKTLPSTIKIKKPQAELKLENSAFYLNTETRPWIRGNDHPRRAGVSSFGFGGTNFHVTVEEYQHQPDGSGKSFPAPRCRTFDSELFLISADEPSGFSADFDINEKSFRFLVSESQQRFNASQPYRLAIVATDAQDLKQKLDQALAYISNKPNESVDLPNGSYYGVGKKPGKLGFLFSGQGSQYLNMGAGIAMSFDCARAAWDQCVDLNIWESANKLHNVVFPNPVFDDEDRKAQEQLLRQTDWAQPAIALLSLSQLNVMDAVGLRPDVVTGHSLGELTALQAAGVYDQETLIHIARHRGLLMRKAANEAGAMMAVFASVNTVEEMLSVSKSGVVIANYNAPQQVILAGSVEQISAISEELKQQGINTQLLAVSTAFHSKFVAPSVAPFKKFLSRIEFNPASLPVFSNLNGDLYPSEPTEIRKQLAEQIKHPVRFSAQIDAMYSSGVRDFVEIGPNAVLTGLVGECLGERDHSSIALDKKGSNGVTQLWNAFAKLSARGYGLELKHLLSRYEKTIDPATLVVPKMTVTINGANYGKLYPPSEGESALPKPNSRDSKIDEIELALKQQYLDEARQQTGFPSSGSKTPTFSNAEESESIQNGNAQAIREVHRELSRVQLEFQSTLADSHKAFLEATDHYLASITQSSELTREDSLATSPIGHVPQQVMTAAPMTAVIESTSRAPFKPEFEQPNINQSSSDQVPVIGAVSSDTNLLGFTNNEIKEMTLRIVAEKTGYPREMLNLDMHLENDLGIDSIKRVEILATLTDRVPNLAELDGGELVKLSTLADITAFIDQAISIEANASTITEASDLSARQKSTDSPEVATTAMISATDMQSVMLDVVAEKTGYPKEMLNLDMHMEEDLGIDSIKRVEILAALTERVPNLAEFDSSELVKLSTLADITAFIDQTLSTDANAPTATESSDLIADLRPAGNSATSAMISATDTKTVLLNVVAEKTGYPKEMLNLDMHLEDDLGIDSIKRVEILAAMLEQVPNLADFDGNELTKLSTLSEIVEFINCSSEITVAEKIGTFEGRVIEAEADEPKIERLALEWVERTRLGFQTGLLQAGDSIVISKDQDGVASALAREFEALDCTVTVTNDLRHKAFDDSNVVVYLGGLNTLGSAKDALAINKAAFRWAKAVAEGFTERGGVFITVQDTGGRFLTDPIRVAPLFDDIEHRPLLGGLAGLAKTAAIEWPQAQVKAIDVERAGRKPVDIAVILIDEILYGGLEREVGLCADGKRGTLINVPASATPAAGFECNSDTVIVASGGARGITAASLIELAQQAKPKFALLGRTVLFDEPEHLTGISDDTVLKAALLEDSKNSGQSMTPIELKKASARILANREIKRNIKRMEAAGAVVRYFSCDISEEASTTEVLNRIRNEWGSIDGLVHGAGVIADKLIADKTQQQFDSVMKPKVKGLLNLLSATATDSLKLICLFSSVAGRWGNSGQADYAMANEILNKVAASEFARRQGNCLVKSINWGPWDSGMVDAALKRQIRAHGVCLISLAAGADKFVAEITDNSANQIEVVLGQNPEGLSRLLPETKVEKRLIVTADRALFTFLSGHQIHGKPVVPYVVVADWISRACQSNWPNLSLYSIDNFRCLKGISLDKTGLQLTISVLELAGNNAKTQAQVDVKSSAGQHFSAEVTLVSEPGETKQKLTQIENLDAWPLDFYYDGEVLFHDEPFRVISKLKGINHVGIEAELVSEATGSVADSLLIDGGIQIVGLWVWKYLGGGALPMRIGSLKKYVPSFNGRVFATAIINATSSKNAVVDVFFHSADGDILAEINSLEVVIYFEKAFECKESKLDKIA